MRTIVFFPKKDRKLRFNYITYGLGIQSAIELPELTTGERPTDVVIRLATTDDDLPTAAHFPSSESPDTRPFMRRYSTEICLLWEGIGRGLVREGREIIVAPNPGVPEHVLRLHILGSALGVLLHQRGLLPLHASVVNIAGRAVIFMGPWGAGKSTTAATFHQHGYALIADDVAAIDTTGPTLMVQPGFPQFKLWPNSVAALGQDPEHLPKIHPELEKRSQKIETNFTANALPLGCIYFLYFADKLSIESMAGADALFTIMTDWYGARFGQQFLEPQERVRLFKQCTRLLKETPVRRLTRPEALETLPDIVQAVVADCTHLYRAKGP